MKYIITESQYKIITEQPDSKMPFQIEKFGYKPGKPETFSPALRRQSQAINSIDKHTLLSLTQIATAFIPVAGVFISAAIGLTDAGLYYKENDKTSAGLAAVFSMLPFVGKIPGIKNFTSKSLALLANKIGLKGGKAALTKAEIQILKAVESYGPEVREELIKMAPKLKSILKDVNKYRGPFIQKYGEAEYSRYLRQFLYDGIDKKKFISILRNVKNPTIKIKPVLGSGADHMVFQSATNPDLIFKAEQRIGEVDKWYNLFKNNQNVFAKTLKKVKVKDSQGKLLSAVVMEKLNTGPFMSLWDNLEKTLYQFQKNLPYNQRIDTLEYFAKNLNKPSFLKKWNDFMKFAKSQNGSLNSKIEEFNSMVNKLYKISPNPDIRKFNLGYDKNGVLKALDI